MALVPVSTEGGVKALQDAYATTPGADIVVEVRSYSDPESREGGLDGRTHHTHTHTLAPTHTHSPAHPPTPTHTHPHTDTYTPTPTPT